MTEARHLPDAEVLTEFERLYAQKLAHRGPGFRFMIERLLTQHAGAWAGSIIETGTAREPGNFEGDGQSTLIWDWFAGLRPMPVFSIDLDRKACQLATGQVSARVKVACADAVRELASREMRPQIEKCHLLYLDSFDVNPNNSYPAAFHALKELAACYAALPVGCMIAVDDCHGEHRGKDALIEPFLANLGILPAYAGYQKVWVKP